VLIIVGTGVYPLHTTNQKQNLLLAWVSFHFIFICRKMKIVKGYRVLDVPLDGEGIAIHHLFIREHTNKNSSAQGRTLFVGNIDCTIDLSHEEIDAYLRILFGRFGAIESISVSAFSDDHMEKTRFAHLVFAKKSSIKLTMNATDNDYNHALKEVASHFGFLDERHPKTISEIKAMFTFFDVDHRELQEEVDEFMREFDENEQRDIDERNASLNVADADGFITVGSR
jgi:hypothetical protein